MAQMNLFEPERYEREPAPVDQAFARKHLNRVLRLVRSAERLPWPPAEAQSWNVRFPALAATLPADEGQPLITAFSLEMERLQVG